MKDMIPSTTEAKDRTNLLVNRHSNGTAIQKGKTIFNAKLPNHAIFQSFFTCIGICKVQIVITVWKLITVTISKTSVVLVQGVQGFFDLLPHIFPWRSYKRQVFKVRHKFWKKKVLPAKLSWKMYIKNRLKINLNITATSASVNVTLANKASWLILPILGLW